MKLRNLVGLRFKERPADCVVDSHAFMIRGGYMKAVGNGIYSEFPILRKVTSKIENIIREEMNKIDGQEVLFPVVMPAELWEESGRYSSISHELLRFSDRNNARHVLGMTHEEASVQLVKEYGQSYQQYPFMIYQIQRKFRDEARPRAGMIRVREFTMKDAYSFHTSYEDLERYYKRCFDAYNRIFARSGVGEVISVQSDSGMMGGSISHEYMLLSDIGEDSIVVCKDCGYSSNMEAAENIVVNDCGVEEDLELVYTPDCESIDDVCGFLHRDVMSSCKAVVYQKVSDNKFVVAFVRGDYEVNETKLVKAVGDQLYPAVIDESSPIVAGYIGPYGLSDDVEYYMDCSLKGIGSLVCGGNKEGYHYTGFNIVRDLGDIHYYDIAKVKDGGICPHCHNHSLSVHRGIEVGNIFQLGTKYTKSMNMQYLDSNGVLQYPYMGCYGIGVGRLAASIIEARHDDFGPIWPISVAPYEVHLCAIRVDDVNTRETADQLYDELKNLGIDVLYDDRENVRAGEMFADADLIGAPIRLVVSPKNLKDDVVEVSLRDKSIKDRVPLSSILSYVLDLKEELYSKLI